ncbi:hypothetical protein STANM309S_03082 [Streptomyces tanashiensis]
MPPSPASPAAIASDRRATTRAPSRRVSPPATHAAAISPCECPTSRRTAPHRTNATPPPATPSPPTTTAAPHPPAPATEHPEHHEEPPPRPSPQTPPAPSRIRRTAQRTPEPCPEFHAHPGPLRTLTREDEHHPATRTRSGVHVSKPSPEVRPGHGPRRPPDARTPHARHASATAHARRATVPLALETGDQPSPPAPAAPRHCARTGSTAPPPAPPPQAAEPSGACSRITCAFVPLTPNDDTPARRGRSRLRPRPRLRQQLHRTRRPVHLRRRLVHVQRRRQHAAAHRLDHLDHTGDTRRGLRVPDVRLQRAEPQRPAPLTPLAIGGEQGLRLDRVAQRRPRAVRLDRVDVRRREPRAASALRITRCCAGPFGAVRPFQAPSWFTAEPRTTASTW